MKLHGCSGWRGVVLRKPDENRRLVMADTFERRKCDLRAPCTEAGNSDKDETALA